MTKKFFLRLLTLMLLFFSSSVLSGLLYRQVYSNSTENTVNLVSVLIREIRPSGGSGKTTDEFIELYNPNQVSVDLSGWMLARQTKSASSTDRETLVIFPPGTIFIGQHHLLVAHSDYSGGLPADIVYTGTSLTDDNTVVLINSTGEVVDLVGYGKAGNYETLPALAPTSQFLSIERLSNNSEGNVQDTNDNAVDFVRAVSNPRNLSSEPIPAPLVTPEVVTSTTEFVTSSVSVVETEENNMTTGTEQSAVLVSTSTAIIENIFVFDPVIDQPIAPTIGSILITEILPIPTAAQVEFIELYNPTTQAVAMSGWRLEDGNGSKTLLSGTVLPHGYLVITKPKGNLNNSGDLVRLVAFDGTVVDQVVYGDWEDGTLDNNAPEPMLGMSLARPNEDFDNNNGDSNFILTKTVTAGSNNKIENEQPMSLDEENTVVLENNTEKILVKELDMSSKPAKEIKTIKKEILRVKILTEKSVEFGEPAIFDAGETTGDGDIAYLWEMGDGTALEGDVVDHIYQKSGYYVVTLTVFDSSMRKIKKAKVQVKEPVKKKVAEASGPKKVTKVAGEIKNIDKPVFVPIQSLSEMKSDSMISVTGLVAAEPDSYNKKKEFYVIDESRTGFGIRVVYKKERPPISRGDRVTVTGKYTVKKDESYLTLDRSDFLVVLRHDTEPLAQAEKISGLAQLSGGLIKVSGQVTEAKKDYAFIDDKTGEVKINGLLKQKISVHDSADITGVLIKTKEGVELHPRMGEDISVKPAVLASTTELEKGRNPPAVVWKRYTIWCALLIFLLAIGSKKIFSYRKAAKLNTRTAG